MRVAKRMELPFIYSAKTADSVVPVEFEFEMPIRHPVEILSHRQLCIQTWSSGE